MVYFSTNGHINLIQRDTHQQQAGLCGCYIIFSFVVLSPILGNAKRVPIYKDFFLIIMWICFGTRNKTKCVYIVKSRFIVASWFTGFYIYVAKEKFISLLLLYGNGKFTSIIKLHLIKQVIGWPNVGLLISKKVLYKGCFAGLYVCGCVCV